MKSVSAGQAERRFSRLLAATEKGEKFLIMRYGRPIAILSPFHMPTNTVERRVAIDHAIALMTKGLPWRDKLRRFRRDEMYEG